MGGDQIRINYAQYIPSNVVDLITSRKVKYNQVLRREHFHVSYGEPNHFELAKHEKLWKLGHILERK